VDDFQKQSLGAIKTLQAAFNSLKNAENASVVLFSTVAVQTGFPFHTLVSSSKGAIEGLTRALAAEWAPKVRVNAIAPSITQTPLAGSLLNSPEKIEANASRHPLKKIGQPHDIAKLAQFLLSEDSSWITGQIHHIDGGISNIKI
jgi:NAD(P)-dependent dehydrogenase (short-subunit alcohol dehydrogenase family)